MENGEYLEAEDFGLHEGKRFAVYFNDAFAGLGGCIRVVMYLRGNEIKEPCNVRRRLLMAMLAGELSGSVDGCTCLLLAEALHHLRGSHDCGWIGAVPVWLAVRLMFV